MRQLTSGASARVRARRQRSLGATNTGEKVGASAHTFALIIQITHVAHRLALMRFIKMIAVVHLLNAHSVHLEQHRFWAPSRPILGRSFSTAAKQTLTCNKEPPLWPTACDFVCICKSSKSIVSRVEGDRLLVKRISRVTN